MTDTFDYLAEKIAHRRCTQYRHNAGPGEPMYLFTAAHLLDFSRELVGESSSGKAGNVKPAARVPDGWKLVPVEPTPEMLDEVPANLGGEMRSTEIYLTMLSAAPAAPADAVAKDVERLDWMIKHPDATICNEGPGGPFHIWFRYSNRTTNSAPSARAAIDAAMQGEKK